MATVVSFAFRVIGDTMDEVATKLDELMVEVMNEEGGEPWLVMADQIEKKAIKPALLDPKSWIYVGFREVNFAGPSQFDLPALRDGFKPQADPGEGFTF